MVVMTIYFSECIHRVYNTWLKKKVTYIMCQISATGQDVFEYSFFVTVKKS